MKKMSIFPIFIPARLYSLTLDFSDYADATDPSNIRKECHESSLVRWKDVRYAEKDVNMIFDCILKLPYKSIRSF